MPKKIAGLSAKAVNALLHKPGRHPVGDVAGLLLQVDGDARSWILRTMVGDKRRSIGLGGFPDVTLSEAREKARAMRAQIKGGADPVAEKHKAKAAAAIAGLTFNEASKRYIAAMSPGWKNPKHRAQWSATLEAYASPIIGKLPVGAVDLSHVMEIISPIWSTKTETAKRVQGRLEAVLAWATVSQLRTGDNPAAWKNNLDKLLPAPRKVRKVIHHRALGVDAMPTFMPELRARAGTAARALEFAILTAARSGEVRGATWAEIDLTEETWTIPGSRIKAGKEHKVPLSSAAVTLVKGLHKVHGTDLLFPSPTGKTLSDATLSAVLKRMGVDAVPHGFRSTFRDWAAEKTNYPREVAEMALAHAIGDKVEAAYRRGDLFAKRTKMMADWARFIGTPSASATITPIRQAKKAGK